MISDLDMIKAREIRRYIKRSRLASSHYAIRSEKHSVLNTEEDKMEITSRFLTQHFSKSNKRIHMLDFLKLSIVFPNDFFFLNRFPRMWFPCGSTVVT